MIRGPVVYGPEARDDLLALYDCLADAASPQVALAYVQRLEAWLAAFDIAPERGTRRDDVRPGLRIIGFERRVRQRIECTVTVTPRDDIRPGLRIIGFERRVRQRIECTVTVTPSSCSA